MIYTLSTPQAKSHFIDCKIEIHVANEEEILVQLPAWRPGRYELGNFAKNLRNFKVVDENNTAVEFCKKTKDSWEVKCTNCEKITITYQYYAKVINAGSTFLNEDILYVNPVNCLVYVPTKMDEAHYLFVQNHEDKKSIVPLKSFQNGYIAANFHELADCPFVFSNQIQKQSYVVNNHTFNIWIQGECKPNWDKILKDFYGFTKVLIEQMGNFPAQEYHFIIFALPYPAYHGVEHLNNTVITLGPGYALMQEKMYNNLLGISSHEIYHSWNVKFIRSADLLPYDYTQENYSDMGYLCEGITTYVGDLALVQGKCVDENEFVRLMNVNFQKHIHNDGRFTLSVKDASVDTWLDGYEKGISNRKTSIYTEGALLAMCLDIAILEYSEGKNNILSLMKVLNLDYASKNIGITNEIFTNVADKYSGNQWTNKIAPYLSSTSDYSPLLNYFLNKVGIKCTFQNNPNHLAHQFGCLVDNLNNKVQSLALHSPAENEGLYFGAEIKSVNNMPCTNDVNEWTNYFAGDTVDLEYKDGLSTVKIQLQSDGKKYFPLVKLEKQNNTDLYDFWIKK
jgi:predicted metalloprotease with PDZ domain